MGPACILSSMTQTHELLLFSTCLGQGTFRLSGISGFIPGRNLRWSGKAEARGLALSGDGKGMGVESPDSCVPRRV